MTIPHLSQEELIDLLKANDWKVVSHNDWDTHKRVMIGKDGHTFPLQLKPTYFYGHVVRICKSLDIVPPEDHLKCYEQQRAQMKAQKKEEQDEE